MLETHQIVEKHYHLPCQLSAEPVWQALGCSPEQPKKRIEIKNSLSKAQLGRYTHVVVPLLGGDIRGLDSLVEMILHRDLAVILQIRPHNLENKALLQWLQSCSRSFAVEWILDGPMSADVLQEFFRFHEAGLTSHLTAVVFSDARLVELIQQINMISDKRLHLYFPYQGELKRRVLNEVEIRKLVKALPERFLDWEFHPPRGTCVWDPRANPQMDFAAQYWPSYISQSKNPNVRFSVIIPTFNNQSYLLKVLRQLSKQAVGRDTFEVIVVDDGSTDNTQRKVIKQWMNLDDPINGKYIYFPRQSTRYMGDGQYRAGISRQLGVTHADGEILCFLDSDIFVSNSYLADVEKTLETYGAVQARRYNLSSSASQRPLLTYKDINQTDLIADEAYWESFNASEIPWEEHPSSWRYVCTHSFSLKKKDFQSVGEIKRNYIFYGFEDTDLGYRLHQAGVRFGLLEQPVYHLFHEDYRSEYSNSALRRHRLLAKTAKIFYRHNFSEEVYGLLHTLIRTPETSGQFFTELFKTLTLAHWWWPRYRVFRWKRP